MAKAFMFSNNVSFAIDILYQSGTFILILQLVVDKWNLVLPGDNWLWKTILPKADNWNSSKRYLIWVDYWCSEWFTIRLNWNFSLVTPTAILFVYFINIINSSKLSLIKMIYSGSLSYQNHEFLLIIREKFHIFSYIFRSIVL